MEKEKLIILCDLGVGGERGRVFSPKSKSCAISATEYKDPLKVIKQWENHHHRKLSAEQTQRKQDSKSKGDCPLCKRESRNCDSCNQKMEKKIIYLGNYYNANQGQTGSVYGRQGLKPTICSIDGKKGKGLVLRKWKEKARSS